MKKAMFALVVLVVVSLPGMGQAQEAQGNNTLPEYTLWLPVVRHDPPWWTQWIYRSECPYPVLVNPPILEVGKHGELYVAAGQVNFEFQIADECDLDGPSMLQAGIEIHNFTQGLGSPYLAYGKYTDRANRYFVHFEQTVVLESGKMYHVAMGYEDGSPHNPGPFRGIAGTIIFAR